MKRLNSNQSVSKLWYMNAKCAKESHKIRLNTPDKIEKKRKRRNIHELHNTHIIIYILRAVHATESFPWNIVIWTNEQRTNFLCVWRRCNWIFFSKPQPGKWFYVVVQVNTGSRFTLFSWEHSTKTHGKYLFVSFCCCSYSHSCFDC